MAWGGHVRGQWGHAWAGKRESVRSGGRVEADAGPSGTEGACGRSGEHGWRRRARRRREEQSCRALVDPQYSMQGGRSVYGNPRFFSCFRSEAAQNSEKNKLTTWRYSMRYDQCVSMPRFSNCYRDFLRTQGCLKYVTGWRADTVTSQRVTTNLVLLESAMARRSSRLRDFERAGEWVWVTIYIPD